MLNLERLRTLDALARHGSVSGAAEGLHITTSAVSQQMAKLEREVGQRLLAKHGRGVRLTDAGRLLAEHAARILSQVELAQADLEAQRGQVAGELRISAFPTAARGLFPAALADLKERHPALRVRSRSWSPRTASGAWSAATSTSRWCSTGTTSRCRCPTGWSRRCCWTTRPTWPCRGHPLAGRDEIDLAELAEDEWITWGEGEFCHEWLMFTLRSKGVEPIVAHRAAESHTQLNLVAAGLGVCVAPLLGRDPLPGGVVTVPLRQRVRRHVFVVWRADADRRPSIRAAVRALRAAGSGSGRSGGRRPESDGGVSQAAAVRTAAPAS